ncbi:MAG: STAS domain-containing protein [Acidimicrobiales bacterium]
MTFEIGETRHGEVPVVAVAGEIDMATAPALRERLVAHETGHDRVVVVDLTSVTFIDSTALGVLVGAYRRLGDVGSVLRLVVTEARILKVFEITDLVSVFPIFDTVAAAVAG